MSTRARLLCLLLPFTLLACEREPTEYSATLERPGQPIGAAIVHVAGIGVVGVSAAGSTRMYHESIDENPGTSEPGFRVVLVNTTPGPLTFRIATADARRRPTVRIVDLVDEENRKMVVPSGLSVRLSR